MPRRRRQCASTGCWEIDRGELGVRGRSSSRAWLRPGEATSATSRSVRVARPGQQRGGFFQAEGRRCPCLGWEEEQAKAGTGWALGRSRGAWGRSPPLSRAGWDAGRSALGLFPAAARPRSEPFHGTFTGSSLPGAS